MGIFNFGHFWKMLSCLPPCMTTGDEEVPRDEDGVTRGVSTEVVEEEELNNFLETKHLLLYSVNK